MTKSTCEVTSEEKAMIYNIAKSSTRVPKLACCFWRGRFTGEWEKQVIVEAESSEKLMEKVKFANDMIWEIITE